MKEMCAMNNKNYEEMLTEAAKPKAEAVKVKTYSKEWSADELQLLIKAVNLFPAGTVQRWDVVAAFINQHTKTPEVKRMSKETLTMAKEMQSGNFSMSTLKEEVNKMAYENMEKVQKRDTTVKEEATDRTDDAASQAGLNATSWSPEEQKTLEQALKTFTSSTPERWDKISECLPGRSKKDCMKRYKELAELVKAKKAAQQAAAKKS